MIELLGVECITIVHKRETISASDRITKDITSPAHRKFISVREGVMTILRAQLISASYLDVLPIQTRGLDVGRERPPRCVDCIGLVDRIGLLIRMIPF